MTATFHPALRGGGRAVLAGLVGMLGSLAISVPTEAAESTSGHRLPTRVALATTPGIALHHRRLPPGRKIVRYTVRPGDTATELAVRFHAWTAELISHNHLGPSATLYAGQRIRIPVVLSAVRQHRHRHHADGQRGHHHRRHHRRHHRGHHRGHHRAHHHRGHHHHAHAARPDPSRAVVRHVIIRVARRHGVDPQLALAVSWQEAGWQMHHVSSAGAIGAMQVIPPTGVWMSMYAGRYLRLREPRDNVLAGVLLLGVLDDMTRTRRGKIGAYYQGVGAVREHGLYPATRHYVANVLAIKRRLEHGWNPAR